MPLRNQTLIRELEIYADYLWMGMNFGGTFPSTVT